jgi:hypothetical protein
MNSTKIIIQEFYGFARCNEPVTVGIPFPRGLIHDASVLHITDTEKGPLPLQTQVLATWPDGSAKWILLDFQASVAGLTKKHLDLSWEQGGRSELPSPRIQVQDLTDCFVVDTGASVFHLDKKIYRPFRHVFIHKDEIIDGSETKATLTGEAGETYEPVVKALQVETSGPLRTTVKIDGVFQTKKGKEFAKFFSRISFFAGQPLARIDFTIHNPRAAVHPGGLWDLGDPGSIYFKDLSLIFALNCEPADTQISYSLYEDPVPTIYDHLGPDAERRGCAMETVGCAPRSKLTIYQDSSGGENWGSRNHVNWNNEVKTSFRGFRVFLNDKAIASGLRANPFVCLKGPKSSIAVGIQQFWQNFPKALDAEENELYLRFFPKYFDDVYELQGGEQKTHSAFVRFGLVEEGPQSFPWIQNQLVPRAEPEWYAGSEAVPYLVPRADCPLKELTELVQIAIHGSNTFFHRRETIDEYGWRNFGEFYADHENQKNQGEEPIASHYNNQYDGIYGALIQYLAGGDIRWFVLAAQLSWHVADIDIYHTVEDRPEYNHGLFWHTDHYANAFRATHRCFSKDHAAEKNLNNYGGGPSLSHLYSTGLLLTYLITGEQSIRSAFGELADFAADNLACASTLTNAIIEKVRKIKNCTKNTDQLVDLNKVYGLGGPGRASGNMLNTLVDAFYATNDGKCIIRAEFLIHNCVGPNDDLSARELGDVENRWMYLVFLQGLKKYLDLKEEIGQIDSEYAYAKNSLIHYTMWMADNEKLFLDQPEKLEYPTETWAVQDFRKVNILLSASRYVELESGLKLISKAQHLYRGALKYLLDFESQVLTRPIVLLLNNNSILNNAYLKFYQKKENIKNVVYSGNIKINGSIAIKINRIMVVYDYKIEKKKLAQIFSKVFEKKSCIGTD